MNLKYRVLLIAGLVLASIFALYPRKVVERVRGPNGFQYDTVKRVPLKRGLDLQGGMHLALEVDESKGRVPDKAEAIDRALKVVDLSLVLSPDHPGELRARASILSSLGAYRAALADVERCLALSPQAPDLHNLQLTARALKDRVEQLN